MVNETVLTNARLVLPDEVVLGSLRIVDGRIAGIDTGPGTRPGAIDCEGDHVAPGLIELHTDNLERHMMPRPGVDWPHGPAILAHDAELASVGVTTVFDALRVGSERPETAGTGRYRAYARPVASAILDMRARGALRISHFLHLRAEICSDTLEEELADFGPGDRVGIVSLMDHTPGQRQFADLTQLRTYMQGKYGLSEAEFDAHVARRRGLGERMRARHEAAAVEGARHLGAILASHDDTTPDHVVASARHGARLAEFPTTPEAARACRAHGIAVMMGAPNLIRGGSHSGNVSAADLSRAGLLDILSSDYVPAALLMAAVRLGTAMGCMAEGLARVTAAPADAAGLADRGRLGAGLRADLIRFTAVDGAPVLRGTWVRGLRVA
ncbi:MAG: alpha-D-ribose 1-methylphosphonate 5-triphosphate diphosphatase [Alkalilacustris sp.]